jgi:class 3 adenylate cyclase/predicted ATPase
MDVAAWLRGLGLEQYAQLFLDNDIDGEILCGMTAEDLKELGISSFGHRRKLLNAIAALGGWPPTRDVAQSATSVTSPPTSPPPIDAERRQLTVMFCDLVGSTPLSTRFDPEDLRAMIGAYHRCVAETAENFGGFVARYMGDGALIYFGYPQAHEDDAERAIRCGLAMIARVSQLNLAEDLHARVGVATGLVVVGGEIVEHDVVGETPNLAARLQALAEPDTVIIAASTRRLTGELFEYRDLGAIGIRGITTPVPAWQVLRPSAVESRFEALRGSTLTPLVGRDEEIELLSRRWARGKTGYGQIVLISGEPGIGKSRLTAALAERLHTEPYLRLRYFCSPHYQDSALFPFIDQLGRAAGFARDDPPAARLEKLETLLALAAPPDEDVAFLADLLSLPASERHPLPDLSSQRKKERTLKALLRQLAGLARRQPVLMIFEDLHWADPTSRELLDLTVEQIERIPVLLIATFRPEFQAPWTGQQHVTALALRRLGRQESSALVRRLIGSTAALSTEVVDEVVERSDGVPLFVEELTKAVLESASAGAQISAIPATPTAVPATLHASLMARLDRLGSAAKETAQIGAAIGREFPYGVAAAVAQRSEEDVQEGLGSLVNAGLVFQRGVPPQATFLFKHALVRDAAHGTLLRGPRQLLHARIAKALETQYPELMETQPEVLAQHCAEAGVVEKSVAYWGKAGRRSVARSAMAEAAAQFQQGLDQLALLSDDPKRRRQELEFWSALGPVLQAVKGVGAPDTGHAYARARELWEQLGSSSEFLHVPFGQSRYHMFRGDLDLALRLDEDFLLLSGQRNDSAGLVLGHYSSGRDLMLAGRFVSSRSHLEQALSLYDPTSHCQLIHQAGLHPHVNSLGVLANVLLCLGFPEQALARGSAAIAEARRLVHPPSLATSLTLGSRLLSLAGDNAALDGRPDEVIAIANEQGFPHWRAEGTIYRGWVAVMTGDVEEGISLLRSGSSAFRSTGAEAWMPQHIALLARACEIAGQIEEASTLLDDALHTVKRTGERWYAAELNRHKGQLRLRQGHTEAAENLYCQALSIAQQQEAKLWELRAAVSLAQLWRDQGRRAEARDIVAPVYGWFTEGFGTPDLKEAKALLDELT